MQTFAESTSGEPARALNHGAAVKEGDAIQAGVEIETDQAALGFFTSNVMVWDTALAQAKKKAEQVKAIVSRAGFTCKEETFNALEAFKSMMPGQIYANFRALPVMTYSLSHVVPLSSVWPGMRRNEHAGMVSGVDLPHLVCSTPEGTPFFLNINPSDVGHTAVWGPTGSGKSTFLNLLELQFFKYPGSQVIVFDKGKSCRQPCLACGGLRFLESASSLAEISGKQETLKTGTITALQKEQKTVPPPRLFNLTALQKEAHKKFAYTPEQTLNIAQALYEKHKCLSYPRTPSRVMGDENVGLVKTIYEKLSGAYAGTNREADMAGAEASRISGDNKRLFNSADLRDHHALIPLEALPENATEEEGRIYSLVFRRFFNLLKSPYVYNAVAVDVDIAGFPFRGNGVELIQTGWKTEPDEEEEPEEDYSRLAEGGRHPVSSVSLEEKFTAPKKHYTFSSILQLMENPRSEDGKHLTGLGTPATRGAVLQKLVDRGYIALQGKNIRVSDEGVFLMGSVMKSDALAAFISIPETTRWEEQLHSDTAAFLEGIKDFVRHAVADTSIERFQEEKMSPGKCPLCGGNVYEGKKNYYCSNYKSEPKCAFTIWKEISGAAVTQNDAKTLLAGKHTKPKQCKSRAGKEFHAAFSLQEGEVKFMFDN